MLSLRNHWLLFSPGWTVHHYSNVDPVSPYHKPKPQIMITASKKNTLWNALLLAIRIWLGYRMITASYSSVRDIIFHPKERAFFEKWFGEELHFPMPLLMAFLAKRAEFAGGVLLIPGFFTRVAASLIAFTMFVATISANLGENFNID